MKIPYGSFAVQHHVCSVDLRASGRPIFLFLIAFLSIAISNLLIAIPRASAVTFIQSAGATSDSGASTFSQSFPSANNAGNLIVVAASWGDNPAGTISVSDTLHNLYFLASSDYDAKNRQGLAILYAINNRSGSNAVTVNFGQPDHYRRIIVSEYSGINTASPVDVTAKHQGFASTSGDGATSGQAVSTSGGDLIFGAVMDDSGSFGAINAGTSFVRRFALNKMDTVVEDSIQSAAGPLAATFSFSKSNHYLAQMVAFRQTGIGETPPPGPFTLSCAPTTLGTNASSTCTITLPQAAPTGGSAFSLSTNSTFLIVPSSVNVLMGSSSVGFLATAGSPPTTQTAAVTATSVSNWYSNRTSAATITVNAAQAAAPPPISVAISPANASLTTSQSSGFTATVQNDLRGQGVRWSISGSGCSGSACGVLSNATQTSVTYTAPTSAPNPSFVTLSATSVSDVTKSASTNLTITVPAPPDDPPAGNGKPTLVQRTSASNTQSNETNTYTIRFPDGTQGGNCVIVGFQFSHGYGVTSVSVTDDRNNSYTVVLPQPGNDDNLEVVNAAYATNVSAGARAITIKFNGGSPTGISAAAFEYFNIAPSNALDGRTGGSGSSASVSAGSLTTTSDNDLIWQYAVQDAFGSAITLWSSDAGAALRTADDLDSQVVQDQVQTFAGSITPALTMSPARNWNTVAIALKPAITGSSAPSGIRVVGIQHNAIAASVSTNPMILQFPCSGNLIVAMWLGIGGYDITRITDTASNSYSSAAPVTTFGASGDAQILYAANAKCSSDLQLQVFTSGSNSSGGSELALYDISGAAISPFDAAGTAASSQNTSGDVSTASVTPSAPGVVIAMLTVESNTVVAVSPGTFDSADTQPAIRISPLDQNGGLAHNYHLDETAERFIWTMSGGASANWASIAAAFKAP